MNRLLPLGLLAMLRVEIGIASISNGDGESVEMNMKSIPMHYLQIREVQVSTAFRSLSS